MDMANELSVVQAPSLSKALRLNPRADAEALAHAGLLMPTKPESVINAEGKMESQPAPSSSLPSPDNHCNKAEDADAAGIANVTHDMMPDGTSVNDPEQTPGAQQEVVPHFAHLTHNRTSEVGSVQAHSSSLGKSAAVSEPASLGADSDADRCLVEAPAAVTGQSSQDTAISHTVTELSDEVMKNDSPSAKRCKLSSLSSDLQRFLVSPEPSSQLLNPDPTPVAVEEDLGEAVLYPGPSPLLDCAATSLSPCSPTLVRSVAAPSRVKVPKQRPSYPMK